MREFSSSFSTLPERVISFGEKKKKRKKKKKEGRGEKKGTRKWRYFFSKPRTAIVSCPSAGLAGKKKEKGEGRSESDGIQQVTAVEATNPGQSTKRHRETVRSEMEERGKKG